MNMYNLFFLFFISFALQSFEKPIVIIIPSFNNAQWYKRNLDSVCFQHYSNYRVIYIDDASTDGTGELVQNYIDNYHLHDKVTLVRNTIRKGAMANHYTAAWMCDDKEIILHVDGDDWLAHQNVLAIINQAYQDEKIWLTYGQFKYASTGEVGFCQEIPHDIINSNAFRQFKWVSSHLRTFYAGLFKKINLRDFKHKGSFLKITCDLAIMFPLLELAGIHSKFISEVLYIYNDQNPISDGKKNPGYQVSCNQQIRSKKPYAPTNHYLT